MQVTDVRHMFCKNKGGGEKAVHTAKEHSHVIQTQCRVGGVSHPSFKYGTCGGRQHITSPSHRGLRQKRDVLKSKDRRRHIVQIAPPTTHPKSALQRRWKLRYNSCQRPTHQNHGQSDANQCQISGLDKHVREKRPPLSMWLPSTPNAIRFIQITKPKCCAAVRSAKLKRQTINLNRHRTACHVELTIRCPKQRMSSSLVA